jgi:hypothetical protein
MEKNINDRCCQHGDSKPYVPLAGNRRENPQKNPGNPFPNQPKTPAKPDGNPDPTRIRPGGNQPEKNDPTRIEEPSKNK